MLNNKNHSPPIKLTKKYYPNPIRKNIVKAHDELYIWCYKNKYID